jgi:type I restriction enzyme M protein
VSEIGRLDAEHFQPKYDAAIAEARKRGAITVPLSEIICPLIAGVDWRDFVESGVPYIRVGDVKAGRIAKESAEKVPISVAETSKDIKLRVGDIAYTRKGSFGNAAIARPGDENCVISTEIIRLRITDEWKSKILPEYLAAYINSQLGRWQSEKWAHGAAFYSVSQDDLLKFAVLIPPLSKQSEIKASIDKSEEARQRAQTLLAAAQRAVEIAIEDSEASALSFLADKK